MSSLKSKKRLKKKIRKKLKGKPPEVQREVQMWFRKNLPWTTVRRPKQTPPDGDWFIWLLRCGRGFGKTRTLCEWVHSRAMEKKRKIALAGETPADVREDVIHGSGGLFNCTPGFDVGRVEYKPTKRKILWPNGSEAIIYSGANPDQFRGFSGDTFACDEYAAWDYPEESLSNLLYGVREGIDIRGIIATTPKPLSAMKKVEDKPGTVVTTGSSYENRKNLAERYYEEVIEPDEGTERGQQEIHAKYVEGFGLWNWELISGARENFPSLEGGEGGKRGWKQIVVAVDPSTTDNDDSDEPGIVVTAHDYYDNLWVCEDATPGQASPDEWAEAAVNAYDRWDADRIVAEVNNGGDMVESMISNADKFVPYDDVRATRGKKVRAQPVSQRYERGEAFHLERFEKLEDQMVEFVGDNSDDSPDRVDALVWGETYLQGDHVVSGLA